MSDKTNITPPPDTIEKEYTTLNLGPTHPATHGIFQNVLKMDGEIIHDAVPTLGYIHRAFEKLAERRPYAQITPITDRLNYCSSPINNMGWHMTVEKLIKAEIPKRVEYMRVIVMAFPGLPITLSVTPSLGRIQEPRPGSYTYFNGVNIFMIFLRVSAAHV